MSPFIFDPDPPKPFSIIPPSANGNKCGHCTFCCKATRVVELNKPVNKWCEHCAIGDGCTIYNDRPKSCSDFRCIWLSGGLPPDLRPDKCKVMFERLPSGKVYLCLVDPGRPDAWREANVQDIIRSFVAAGRTVVVNVKPNVYLMPPGKDPEEVREDIKSALVQYGML